MSCSNSYCSISISIYFSACSISWVKSFSCDDSPYLLDANYLDDSNTYMGVVSSICTSCAPYHTSSFYSSFSYLRSSCSFLSFSFNSCNSFSVSSIFYFSLFLCVFHLSCCCLFASISIATFSTSGSAQNLQLCSSSMQSTIFLLPLSCTRMFTSIFTATSSALWDASSLSIP